MFSGSGKAEGRPRAIPGLARYTVVGYVRTRKTADSGHEVWDRLQGDAQAKSVN